MTKTLPKGWVKATLEAVTDVARGKVDPQEHKNLPYIGMENVQAHTMRILGHVDASEMKSAAVHFSPGYVLYGRLRPYLNKVVSPDFEGLASAEFIPLIPRSVITNKFLQYRINAADFVAFASQLDEGDRPRVDYKQIGAFRVNVPPLEEQHRIVAAIESYFTRLDEAVEALERAQRNLKRYRASVLKAAVEGRLVPNEAEVARREGRDYEPADRLLARILDERRRRWEEAELARLTAKGKAPKNDAWKAKYSPPAPPNTDGLPELPEGWCWATVEQLGEVVTGITPSTASPEFYGDDVPFFKPSDLDAGPNVLIAKQYLSTLGASKVRQIPVGTVMVTCIGATIGKTGIARVEGGTNQQINSIMTSHVLLDSYYLFCFFSSYAGHQAVVSRSSSTTLPIINKSKFESIPLPLPPLTEQTRIVEAVTYSDEMTKRLEETIAKKLAHCAQLRQSILRWAFEGRLVDQADAVEEAMGAVGGQLVMPGLVEVAAPAKRGRKKKVAG